MTSAAAAHAVRVKVTDQHSNPLTGLLVKAVPVAGGKIKRKSTNDSGIVKFNLPAGDYKFKAVCLGYSFSSSIIPLPDNNKVRIVIPQRQVPAMVQVAWSGEFFPRGGVPVTLVKPKGKKVVSGPAVTGEDGKAFFTVCRKKFYFRADLGGASHRSKTFKWQSEPVNIPAGKIEVTVLHGEEALAGAPLSVLTDEGEPVGLTGLTGSDGKSLFYLPEGDYFVTVLHDDRAVLSDPCSVVVDESLESIIQTQFGNEPVISYQGAPHQIPDGKDMVEFLARVTDEEGDDCRLKIEYSLDGLNWSMATIDESSVTLDYYGPVGHPIVDNSSPFQIGRDGGIPTHPNPNTVAFRWDASRDLPTEERLVVFLRLTVNDFLNSRQFVLPTGLWKGLGHELSGPGLNGTPDSSWEPALALDSAGRPHVAWIESSEAGDSVAYLKWNGRDWVDGDGSGREGAVVHQTAGYIYHVSLALDQNDRPRLAWDSDEAGSFSIYYLERTATGWKGCAGESAPPGPIFEWPTDVIHPRLRVDGHNISHVLFHNDRGDEIHLFYLSLRGGRWVDAGGRDQSGAAFYTAAGPVRGTDLALDSRGRPQAVWAEYSPESGSSLHHLYLEDKAWRSLQGETGGSQIGAGAYFQPSITMGRDDQPHVFWEDSPPGSSEIKYAFWDGSGWSETETIFGPLACCPEAVMTGDGKPAVAFIDYPTGYGEPVFLFRDGDWRPWPDLPGKISPGVGDSWGVSPAFTPGDVPMVAFDDFFLDNEEIYCAFPLAGKLELDTLPPSQPGPLSIVGVPTKNTVNLLFGQPAAEQHFREYLIEASADPEFAGEIYRWDRHDDPCLGHLDFAGISGTIIEGLDWDQSYYFRITAVDLAGHRSSSQPAGPATIPEDIFPPQISVEKPEDGVVLPDRAVTIEGTVDDHDAAVTVNGDPVESIEGYFLADVTLAEGDNEILIRAVDETGNESIETIMVVSIPLDIDSPPDGAFIRGMLLDISGEAGSNCSLITAGEYFTLPAEGHWAVSPLPISEGDNLLVVRAHDELGRYSEREIAFSGSGEDFSIEVTAAPPCGAVPVDVALSLDAGGLEDVSYVSWDADGDGLAEVEGLGLKSCSFRYEEPGIYYPEVVLTDETGLTYRGRGRIRIHQTPELVASLPASSPRGLALDDDGFVYISEEGENRVLILDDRFDFYGEITRDDGEGISLNSPAGLEVDELGYLWVCDSGNYRVLAFDREGNYYGRWIWSNSPFESIHHDGPIFYATEKGGSRIFKFERKIVDDTLAITTWGSGDLSLEESGGVSDPGGMTMERGGRMLISDTSGDRILIYRDEPSFAENLYYLGEDPREVLSPKGVTYCRRTGESAVVEELTGQVRLFDNLGEPAAVIGAEAFDGIPLNDPGDVAMRAVVEGMLLYIADTGNDRVLIVLVPSESPLLAVEAFRQAVQSGDVEAIMETVHPIGMEKSLAKIEDLGENLPEAAPYFEAVEIVSVEGNLARGRVIIPMTIEEVTGDFEFEIILMKDEYGQWKMLDF